MAPKLAGNEPGDELPFEEALARLETIVEELESGELSLDQSLRHYEEGMKLSKRLGKTLDEAEKTIERLEQSGDDENESGPRSRKKAAARPAAVLSDPDDVEGQLPF